MIEKRKQKRLTLDKSLTIHCLGEPCRVADVSLTGLGITFISGEDWPENITLEYSLPQQANQKRLVQCRTVWESGMPFYKTARGVTIRRRGLEFVESGSGAVHELYHHLKTMTVENQ